MSAELKQSNNTTLNAWKNFSQKHPNMAQFLIFFVVSNGVTLLQMFLMPFIKYLFGFTSLVDTNFQILQVGHNLDGSAFYIFDYAKGAIAAGGGGGLAYFLAVEIALGIAQIINFFLQRNVTFKSNSNIWKAATWYFIAYLIISTGAAALQGVYKVPIYNYFIGLCGDSVGIVAGDIVTMIVNCAISFWVFFPIFKIIFKEESNQ